jgi:hypothetical protein
MSTPHAEDPYPRIVSVVDSFGNKFDGPAKVDSEEYVVVPAPKQVLHPGDVVTFNCVAVDPHNRPLSLTLDRGSQKATSTDGSPVELTWHVADGDVSLQTFITISLRTVDAEFHRFGSLGDQRVVSRYRVDPPPNAV